MLLNTSKILMEQIFHGQFSLYDAAIFAAILSAQIGHGITEKGI